MVDAPAESSIRSRRREESRSRRADAAGVVSRLVGVRVQRTEPTPERRRAACVVPELHHGGLGRLPRSRPPLRGPPHAWYRLIGRPAALVAHGMAAVVGGDSGVYRGRNHYCSCSSCCCWDRRLSATAATRLRHATNRSCWPALHGDGGACCQCQRQCLRSSAGVGASAERPGARPCACGSICADRVPTGSPVPADPPTRPASRVEHHAARARGGCRQCNSPRAPRQWLAAHER